MWKCDQEDGLLYVEVDPSGTDSWKLEPVADLLKEGAVGVIPTDTVYVFPLLIIFQFLSVSLKGELYLWNGWETIIFHKSFFLSQFCAGP